MSDAGIINKMDWNDLQFFLVFSRFKSYAATARQLNVNRTTVSRHIRNLEVLLKTKLFTKIEGVYSLTKEGDALIPYAENMEQILLSIQKFECLDNNSVKGMVRLSLPSCIGIGVDVYDFSQLLQQNKGFEIELVSNDSADKMLKREIDLEVTFNRPLDGALVIKRLADFKMGLFATQKYMHDKPAINSYTDLKEHILIGEPQDTTYQSELVIEEVAQQCEKLTLVSSSLKVRIETMLQGHGLCVMPYFMVKPEMQLVQILPNDFECLGKIWIVIHEDMRYIPKIRAMADHIFQQSQAMQPLFLAKPNSKKLSPASPAH